jgi:hypothetical protein
MHYETRTKIDEKSFPEEPWYRYRGYRIVNGAIRPAERAPIEAYNPWELYRQSMRQRRTVETPYSRFLNLGRLLQPFRGKRWRDLPPEIENYITLWCGQFGLVGVLASTAVEILLPALKHESRKHVSLRQVRYYRSGGSWGWQETNPPEWKTPPAAYVMFWNWDSRLWQKTSLDKIAPFFPSVEGPRFQYPHFDSSDFGKFYAEPVVEFARTCVLFYESALVLSNHLRGVSPLLPGMSTDRESVSFALNESVANLDSLRLGIGPTYTLDEGKLIARNGSVSLISSFAGMLFLDLARNRRVMPCARCGTIFVSDEGRARFCSAKCRTREANCRFRELHPYVAGTKTLRPVKRRGSRGHG